MRSRGKEKQKAAGWLELAGEWAEQNVQYVCKKRNNIPD
jgi:hypothetical protein